MHTRVLLVVGIAGALALPTAAHAGAPNYDCVVGRGGVRVAIDQWAPDVVATGLGPGQGVLAEVHDVNQNGPTLTLTTTVSGVPWSVAIGRFGAVVRVTSAGKRLFGHCTMIPGDLILRRARGGEIVRSRPSATARRLSTLWPGAAIWERPVSAPSGWLPVLRVVFVASSVRTQSGWLRQRGLYQLPPLLARSR
jgi:hypothetical protein